jgi:hypothetical protein
MPLTECSLCTNHQSVCARCSALSSFLTTPIRPTSLACLCWTWLASRRPTRHSMLASPSCTRKTRRHMLGLYSSFRRWWFLRSCAWTRNQPWWTESHESSRVATTSFVVGTSTRTCLLIAKHISPMSSGMSSCSDGTWLSPARRSNYSMRPLVLLRRPMRQAIRLRGITLTILGCHTRRSSWHALWMSFPTSAAPIHRGWRETTT